MFEHYVPGGGMLSANFFYRRIANLMRSQTTLETVSWVDVPRWVARKKNIGNATTEGVELEAKLRLSEMFAGAPKIDVHSNLNWTPEFTTRLSDDQTVYQSNKLVAGAYALWTINPRHQSRVSVSNFAARDYTTGGSLLSTNAQGQTLRETTQNVAPSFVNLQTRLEIKL